MERGFQDMAGDALAEPGEAALSVPRPIEEYRRNVFGSFCGSVAHEASLEDWLS